MTRRQPRDSSPEVGARIVVETTHEGMLCERPVNDGSLDADAAAVHQPHFAQACGVRFVHVFLDHRRDIAGLEGVQVELGFDGNSDRLVVHYSSASKTAVTEAERPPRTENSPTMVMRRGWQAATRSSRI